MNLDSQQRTEKQKGGTTLKTPTPEQSTHHKVKVKVKVQSKAAPGTSAKKRTVPTPLLLTLVLCLCPVPVSQVEARLGHGRTRKIQILPSLYFPLPTQASTYNQKSNPHPANTKHPNHPNDAFTSKLALSHFQPV